MKILEAIHDFLPDHRAGSEIYTYHLARALQRRGHDVALVFTEKRPDRPQFEVRTGTYETLPFHEITWNRIYEDIADLHDDPRMEAPIGRVLDAVKPDVLHVQALVHLGLGLIRQAAARAIPVVMTLHEYFLLCPRGGLLLDRNGNLCDPIPFDECARCLAPFPIRRERYGDDVKGVAGEGFERLEELRFFARAARTRLKSMQNGVAPVAKFIAPSRFLAERMIREGLPRGKVVVSDYGFPPLERRRRAPRDPRRPGARLAIGFLGTLSDYKGVHVLLDAFARLPPGKATLAVAGDPTWFPDYTGPLVERAGTLEGARFVGPLAPDAAADFVSGLDVLVVPSIWYENSPLTLHEAFQLGVPVVTTDLGGMAELVENGGGLTFARGDSADLARVLGRLIDDEALLVRLAASSPPVKSIEVDAGQVESILRAALAR